MLYTINRYLAKATYESIGKGGDTKTTKTRTNPIDPSDDLYGPWKCKKCNINFTDKEVMFKHWIDTAVRKPPDHKGVWFHVIVDRDGDYIAYRKPVYT